MFGAKASAVFEDKTVKLDAEATFGKLVEAQLKLVKFSVRNRDIMNAANSSPSQLDSAAGLE